MSKKRIFFDKHYITYVCLCELMFRIKFHHNLLCLQTQWYSVSIELLFLEHNTATKAQ